MKYESQISPCLLRYWIPCIFLTFQCCSVDWLELPFELLLAFDFINYILFLPELYDLHVFDMGFDLLFVTFVHAFFRFHTLLSFSLEELSALSFFSFDRRYSSFIDSVKTSSSSSLLLFSFELIPSSFASFSLESKHFSAINNLNSFRDFNIC